MRRRWFANDDLQIEVLSRMPIKDVLEYKCVSKEWKQLLSDRSFIKVHSMRVFEPVSGFFFQEKLFQSLVSYISVNVEVDAQVHRSVLHFLPESVVLMSSTNGLICCRSCTPCRETKIYVCNPLNKDWVSLEFPRGYTIENIALAFNPLQNPIDVFTDFKLVRVIIDNESTFSFDVYSSRTKVWKRSAEICMSRLTLLESHYSYTYEGVFAEGMLFWLTNADEVIMFDPEKELSLVLMSPLPAYNFYRIPKMCIGESENKLHYIVLSEHGLHMWVLMDWFTSQWELKNSITFDKLEEENPQLLWGIGERVQIQKVTPLAFKDGLVVMRVSKNVFSYHFKTRKLRKLTGLSRLGMNTMLSATVLPYVMDWFRWVKIRDSDSSAPMMHQCLQKVNGCFRDIPDFVFCVLCFGFLLGCLLLL